MLFPIKTIATQPITTGPAKQFVPTFLRGSLHVLKDCNEVSSEASLFKAEQLQFSQPFYMRSAPSL